MAITIYKSGAQIVTKYGEVSTDFPANGVHVADTITIGVDNQSAGSVTVEYTLDSPADIAGGTATWINLQTVATLTDAFIITEYGPTGVLISAAGAGAVAWIKS